MKYTKQLIREKLEQNQQWLERGVLAVYKFQTCEEQAKETTKEENGVGFNSADAHYLSYVAKWLLKGNHLSGIHLEKAKKKMLKYAGQLEKIAKIANRT